MANGHGGRRKGAGRGKRKATELAVAEGNPGHKANRDLVPLVVGGKPMLEPPPAPADLPPAGKALWEDVVVKLYEAGVADTTDWPALKVLCIQWQRAEDAAAVIAEEGLFTLGSQGQITEHPALAIERHAHALLARFMESFPLTSRSRAAAGIQQMTGLGLAAQLNATLGANPREDGDEIELDG